MLKTTDQLGSIQDDIDIDSIDANIEYIDELASKNLQFLTNWYEASAKLMDLEEKLGKICKVTVAKMPMVRQLCQLN